MYAAAACWFTELRRGCCNVFVVFIERAVRGPRKHDAIYRREQFLVDGGKEDTVEVVVVFIANQHSM